MVKHTEIHTTGNIWIVRTCLPKGRLLQSQEKKTTNICYENTSKPNPAICQRESTPWPSELSSQEQQVHIIIRKSTHAVHHIHRGKERNHVIMGKDEESDEIHNPLVLKNTWPIRVKRTCLTWLSASETPVVNFVLNGERQIVLPPKSRTRMSALTIGLNTVSDVLARALKQES